jgi:hypothetical protein
MQEGSNASTRTDAASFTRHELAVMTVSAGIFLNAICKRIGALRESAAGILVSGITRTGAVIT